MNRVTAFQAFMPTINVKKLKRKQIQLSPSVVYKRPSNKLYIGGEYLRHVDKKEAIANYHVTAT